MNTRVPQVLLRQLEERRLLAVLIVQEVNIVETVIFQIQMQRDKLKTCN